jgi:transcriptional regulator with XRE-family HTH domain
MTTRPTPRPTPSDLVAARIQALRQSRGWTAKDLALRCAELGASQLTAAVIANIETGRRDASGHRRREVSVDELLTIAQALDMPPFDLIQVPADYDPWMDVEITPLVSASRDELASWMRGLSASIPQTPVDGMALCGSCRTPLSLRIRDGDAYYYCKNQSCVSPVNHCPLAAVLEAARAFLEALAPDIDGRASSMILPEATDESAESLKSRIITLYDEVDHLEERRAVAVRDLKDLAEHPELDAKVVASAISSFDNRINAIQREITETRRSLDQKVNDLKPLPALAGVMKGWDILPARALRKMLMTIVHAIVITPGYTIVVEPRWAQDDR